MKINGTLQNSIMLGFFSCLFTGTVRMKSTKVQTLGVMAAVYTLYMP